MKFADKVIDTLFAPIDRGPKTWPLWARRGYVLTFPGSLPLLLAIQGIAIAIAVVSFPLLILVDSLEGLWKRRSDD